MNSLYATSEFKHQSCECRIHCRFLVWSDFSVVLKPAVKGFVPLLVCDYLANAATEFAFI